jgi:hypothetical protein
MFRLCVSCPRHLSLCLCLASLGAKPRPDLLCSRRFLQSTHDRSSLRFAVVFSQLNAFCCLSWEPKMVTTAVVAGSDPCLTALLDRWSGTFRWDLHDPIHRQAFFTTTRAALAGESGLLKVAENGPPSAELIALRNPTMPALLVETLQIEAMEVYNTLNCALYKELIPRIDFSKRATLAFIIDRRFGIVQDGHGLWQYILEAMDFSKGEKQEEVRRTFDLFQLPDLNPTPEILSDSLFELYSFWSLIDGNSFSAPISCIRKAISILPKGNGFGNFASTIRALASFNPENSHFHTYENFVDTVIEQYRGVLVEASVHRASVLLVKPPSLSPSLSPSLPKPLKYNPVRDAPNDCCLCNSVWCSSQTEDDRAGCISFNFLLEPPIDASLNELNFLESGRAHIFLNGSTSLKDVKIKVMHYEKARSMYEEALSILTYKENKDTAALFFATLTNHIS